MENNMHYFYGKFEDFKLVKLPYEIGQCTNKKFSMYIFLPHAKDGLPDVIEKFNFRSNAEATTYTQFSLKYERLCKLWIPKMKFSYDFQPQELMKAKGLTFAFRSEEG